MSTEFSQNKVSETIWPWQKTVSRSESSQPTFIFSVMTLMIAWVIAFVLCYFRHVTIAMLAFTISTFVFIAARFFPRLYAVIERFFQKLSAVVGTTLTWIFLVPFFYVCFPLGKLAQILKKKDPMQRGFKPEDSSYWQTCKESSSVEDYKRQF